jgi:hypothetical protein
MATFSVVSHFRKEQFCWKGVTGRMAYFMAVYRVKNVPAV